jgi:hypothetical protein
MKKVLIIASLLVATVGALAQGSVNFQTKVTAVNYTITAFATDTTTGLLVGSSYLGQLYAGATADSLAPVGSAVAFKVSASTGAGLGWLSGGEVVTTLSPGTGGYFQVKAWQASAGTTYELALAANGVTGFSNTIHLTTLGDSTASPRGLPVDLVGLTAFNLQGVPEPSTIVLGVLGASLFLLRRRS